MTTAKDILGSPRKTAKPIVRQGIVITPGDVRKRPKVAPVKSKSIPCPQVKTSFGSTASITPATKTAKRKV